MEARTILLTSLVLALWIFTITGADFCEGKDDGPYCEHCWSPVQCTDGISTAYGPCEKGMACTVDFGASFCTSHTSTDCACTAVGDQCDAYNINYIEHCDASGPFLVDQCPEPATCNNGECGENPACTEIGWFLMIPDCTVAVFCDSALIIQGRVECEDGEYVNSDYKCAPAPVPACDGSCSGRCPNPVDCTKFFICDGTTAMASGDCAADTVFDIDTNNCVAVADPHTCTFMDGCELEVGSGEITTTIDGITTTSDVITTTSDVITTTSDVITTTSDVITTTSDVTTTTSDVTTTTSDVTTTTSDVIITTSDVITTTTDGGEYTVPPDCSSSNVGSKYPVGPCSKQYYVCAELANGQYGYVISTCLGDLFFNTDPNVPYCSPQGDIDTC